MQPGQLSLHLGWVGTYVQSQHDDFADVVGQGAIPIVHDQDLAIHEARLSLDIGLTARFAASLVVPFRVVSTSIVYRDGRGMAVDLVEPSTHHRNETLTGIADPMLLGALSHDVAGTRLTARAGLTIPLGRTEEDPFVLGEMGLRHQHIQMGTGTVNPVLALEASRRWRRWQLGAFAFTQQVVYESGKGYHAGDRYAGGIGLRRALGSRWTVRGGPEVQAETAERWHGIRHTEEGNQGRVDAILGAGVTWAATRALVFDAAIKVPVYTHVVGGQLDVPAILEVGVAWTFGRPKSHDHAHAHDHEHGDEHEHAHEHADEHEHAHEHAGDSVSDGALAQSDKHGQGDKHAVDTTGADVADVGKNGERVDLVPVPGKLTIFDFWAEWCEPCKKLEPVLVDIARAHPDRVAIRRVEVIDWDSPVADQHLTPGGFGLPHLKIYDVQGRRVFEQSSAPGKLEALIDQVRGLVEPPLPSGSTPPVTPASPPSSPKPPAPPATRPPAPHRPAAVKALVVDIAVTSKGFEPGDIKVPRKRPVVLRFRRSEAKTCATEVVFEHDGKHVVKDLPLDQTVELPITFEQPGTIRYGCAMDMIRGTITVQ
jgi:thiol-disulfide isomerase/thioredoxin